MRFLLVAVVGFLVCFALTAPGHAERRVALVIGNGTYANAPSLVNPRRDADAVADSLGRLGFEVHKVIDADKASLEKRVRGFIDILRGADVGLLFYAGHAMQVGGSNYLIPVDATLAHEDDLRWEALEMQALVGPMEAAVDTALIFLDACRDNPFSAQMTRRFGTRSSGATRGLAKVEGGIGTLIAYATEPGNVAYDGDGANSPFTGALLDYIEQPGLEVRQMLTRVRASVLQETEGQQRPWDSSSLLTDFYFAGSAGNAPPPVPQVTAALPSKPAAPDNAERVLWNAVKDTGDAEYIERYLDRYPNGFYRDEAKALIEEIRTPSLAKSALGSAAPSSASSGGGAGPILLVALPQSGSAARAAVDPGEVVKVWGPIGGGGEGGGWTLVIGRGGLSGFVPSGDVTAGLQRKVRPLDGLEADVDLWETVKDQGKAGADIYLVMMPQGTFSDEAARQGGTGSGGGGSAQLAAVTRSSAPAPSGAPGRDCPHCPVLAPIPAGSFMMGSPPSERGRNADEGPRTRIRVPAPRDIGAHEVTVAEFSAFVEATGRAPGKGCYKPAPGGLVLDPALSWRDPGFAQSPHHPVVCVSWEDAVAYADWLSAETGETYRLPSEAEWEYAARGGAESAYPWGDDAGRVCDHANGRGAEAGAGRCDDGFATTAPVGQFRANGYGLYDMAGNVWEWTLDCFTGGLENASLDGTGASGAAQCQARSVRGGAWINTAKSLRSANRHKMPQTRRLQTVGFRVLKP
ncbi:MAG: SUMF1/EgtB/PvdO family nonheme iron enzyme [Alphaproteobacteria bacterium]|nr:SUMF1/EgtB/PvdO family nonheme iron enzyme [Alphaproteobacteria bacterium]